MLDDVTEIVREAGNKLDVIMLPKVEGPWDIHYLDQLLAQLEAKHAVKKPILIHAILETAEGVKNVEAIAAASPRMHGMSLGPADLAASRGMKTTRVGGGHPDYVVLADAGADAGGSSGRATSRISGTTPSARMVDACLAYGLKPFYGPFGDFSDGAACEAQFRNAFLQGCLGAWSLHPSQIDIAKRVFSPDVKEVAFARQHSRRHARRHGRRHDRRQDAGRRDLEAGQGHRRPRPPRGGEGSGARRGLWLLIMALVSRLSEAASELRARKVPSIRAIPRGPSAVPSACCWLVNWRGNAIDAKACPAVDISAAVTLE